MGAEILVKNGFARPVSTAEAMKILERSKEQGLAQTGDNVQKGAAYICNCCGCCCEMMKAVRVMGLRTAIVTSNWTVEIDESKCRGCGRCAKLCPVDLIDMVPAAPEGAKKPRMKARHAGEFCLGCGVCYTGCKSGAIRMKPRPKRVFTPETTFDKIIAMAIERGRLANLVFEGHEQWGWRAFGRIAAAREKTPPARALWPSSRCDRPSSRPWSAGRSPPSERQTAPIAAAHRVPPAATARRDIFFVDFGPGVFKIAHIKKEVRP
jgi:ferredoxin